MQETKDNEGTGARRRRANTHEITADALYTPKARRQALGKTEELLAEEKVRARRDGRTWHEDAESPSHASYRPEKRKKHGALYGILALICCLLLAGLFVLLAPQLLGIRWKMLPNLAFTSEGMIELDATQVADEKDMRSSVQTERLYAGIFIDGVDVGGMTLQEARTALESVEATGGGGFSVTIEIDQASFQIDDSLVTLTRNVEEMLQKAYALGRQNTVLRGSTLLPIQERYQAIQELKAHPVYLETQVSYDRNMIRAITDAIADSMIYEPVNAQVASFDATSRVFSFTEDRSGQTLDRDALYAAVMQAIDSGDPSARVHMDTEEVLAPITKAELMNAFGKISSYTTSTTSNANRNTNIRLSAEAINGLVVDPGETFSFNLATGQRTIEKGYKEATAISGGQNIPEVGGGVCQTSSTLFNAVARADLEIVTRSPHAWPSSYVDKGMDATVNWPGLDFQFKNQTEWPIYILASYKNQKVTVEIYGHTLQDGITIDLESTVVKTIPAPSGVKEVQNESLPHGTRKTTVKARKGYEVETYKIYKQAGKEIRRELLCKSTYKAYQETIEYN